MSRGKGLAQGPAACEGPAACDLHPVFTLPVGLHGESRKPMCMGTLWGQAVDLVEKSRSSEFPEDTGALLAPLCVGLFPHEPGTRLLALTLV